MNRKTRLLTPVMALPTGRLASLSASQRCHSIVERKKARVRADPVPRISPV